VADRTDFYFRQRVTEAELDLAFTLMEEADRNLATDIGVFGIISGAVPSSHAPVADLTIDMTAPGRAYDKLGERIFFGTGQRVDCSVDTSGVPTDVKTQGNERSLGVFLQFSRQLSDPRTDGNSQQVYFRRDESFQFDVKQGVEAPAGTAVPVALDDASLLVCDVKRAFGRAQILAGDIDLSRRQAFIFARADAVQVQTGLWKLLSPAGATVQATLDATDGVLSDHLSGVARRHPAEAIDFKPHAFLASKTVGAAIDELVDDLVAVVTPAGASRIGVDAIPGTPAALQQGSVRSQLAQLLAGLNGHVGAVAGAHVASAIAATPFAFLTATNVQGQLQALVAALTAITGATLVGSDAVAGKPYVLAAGTARDQLVATLGQLNQLATDLAAITTGLGAAKIGNEALAGSPKTHPAGPVHDQLKGLCDDINAHIPSGDHDVRYQRLTYSNGQIYAPGQTIQHGDIGAFPAIVLVAYTTAFNTTGAKLPIGPFFVWGPLSSQLTTAVTKPGSAPGYNLSVQNGSGQQLYIQVSVYRNGG
jgi:hypothetical protein